MTPGVVDELREQQGAGTAQDRRGLPQRRDQRVRPRPSGLRTGHPGPLVRHRKPGRLPGRPVRIRVGSPRLQSSVTTARPGDPTAPIPTAHSLRCTDPLARSAATTGSLSHGRHLNRVPVRATPPSAGREQSSRCRPSRSGCPWHAERLTAGRHEKLRWRDRRRCRSSGRRSGASLTVLRKRAQYALQPAYTLLIGRTDGMCSSWVWRKLTCRPARVPPPGHGPDLGRGPRRALRSSTESPPGTKVPRRGVG